MASSLLGRRVLIIEDEALIVMHLEQMLAQFGCEVTGSVPTVAGALEMLERDKPDIAILDVNLSGEVATAVADALRSQGVPFVVITAYNPSALPPSLRQHRVRVDKPFGPQQLAAALKSAVDPAPGA